MHATRFTDLVDARVPLVQAPIGSATCPELAAAVADAGALGHLAVTWRNPDAAFDVVAETRDLTDGAFAANVVTDPDAGPNDPEDLVAAVIDAGVDVLSISFGAADRFVEVAHEADVLVTQTVGTADEAMAAADAGVDMVVAQGWEAGGHVQSEVATLPLVPRIVDAVDIPVIAAGGIADGRGIAAVLALGADAAWLGTRFVATQEANAHPEYKRRVTTASEADTVYGTPYRDGWPDQPHRVLENETTRDWDAAGRPDDDRPGEGDTVATYPDGEPYTRYEDGLPVPGMDGDVDAVSQYAGQSTGLVEDVPSAGEVVEQLTAETADALDGVCGERGD